MEKDEKYWRQKLTPEQYKILRKKGTEQPFTGEYYDKKEAGMYTCVACGSELFASDTKFDSGTGWPSFYDGVSNGNVKIKEEISHGMHRLEVVCAKCGGHLGHVFDDGPSDKTGKRYCINSACLTFKKK